MTRMTIDAGLHDKLLDVTNPVELCDSKGRVVGRYFPVLDPAEWEGLECPISQEEIDRRLRDKSKTYTTEEILADLRKNV